MKKNLASLILVPFIAGCLSNYHKNIPITPLPKKITSSHYTLEMEKYLGADESDFEKVNLFLERVEGKVNLKREYSREDAKNILKTIHGEVSGILGKFTEGNIFYEALRTGEADCERFAMLYMSAAERLNLPLAAVFATGGSRTISGIETNVPSHVFVRWKFEYPNHWINYECGNGTIMPDEFYTNRYLSLSEITNFKEWCIRTRLSWCQKEYGTNYTLALEKAEFFRKKFAR